MSLLRRLRVRVDAPGHAVRVLGPPAVGPPAGRRPAPHQRPPEGRRPLPLGGSDSKVRALPAVSTPSVAPSCGVKCWVPPCPHVNLSSPNQPSHRLSSISRVPAVELFQLSCLPMTLRDPSQMHSVRYLGTLHLHHCSRNHAHCREPPCAGPRRTFMQLRSTTRCS